MRVKIPKGWLRVCDAAQPGDKFFNFRRRKFCDIEYLLGDVANEQQVFIRRIRKPTGCVSAKWRQVSQNR